MTFFSWYTGIGIQTVLGSVGVCTRFLLRFFWIEGHIRTLFAPWHRDVSFRVERGLHPILAVQRVIENLFARTMGMIVRICVIASGLIVIILFYVCIAAIVLVWFGAPLVVLAIVGFLFVGWWGTAVVLVMLTSSVGVLIWSLYRRMQTQRAIPYEKMTLAQLHREPWFARVYHRIGIEPHEVTDALLADFDAFAAFLREQDLTVAEFERIMGWEIARQEKEERAAAWWREENLRRIRPIGQYWTYGYTITLDRYAQDLSLYDASEYATARFVGRAEALHMMMLTMERPQDNNTLLIGDPGVGKNTLVHAVAHAIRRGDYDHDPLLRDKRIVILDLAEALSQAQNASGDVDLFLHQLFHEAAYAGNVVLVIDDVHRFTQNSKTSYDITPILANYLSVDTFQMIGLTSRKAFHTLLEQRDDLLKYFTMITIDELDEDDSITALLHHFERDEASRVLFTYQALRDIVRLSGRYRIDAPLPERAIDLAMQVGLYWRDQYAEQPVILQNIVRTFLTEKTGMPMGAIDDAEREKLLNLETFLHERIVGQEQAVQQIADAVRVMRSGIANQNKPMSSFLFLGPTGVGKTETAKALAEVYYGSPETMIRMDMSEFQGQDAYKLLIGDAETNDIGRLTTAAREHPYALLLLDELEKAHPRALDLFLQILDEGYITDAFGDRISFRNMIIIATSNAGAVFLRDALARGEDVTDIKQKLIDHIVHEGIYRLEFLNRFSDVILFRPLTDTELDHVVRMMFQRLSARILQEKNITVTVADDVIPIVIARGYNPLFGARSVARFVDDALSDVIARKIITGEAVGGGTLQIAASDMQTRPTA